VIALGDSFTWGSKIASSDSTWPSLLEHLLTQPPEGKPTEVINMGQSGFALSSLSCLVTGLLRRRKGVDAGPTGRKPKREWVGPACD
jgi:lysophospholipase L1-like esterase